MKKWFALFALLGLGVAVGSFWEQWIIEAIAPGVPFASSPAPRAPEYSDEAMWTALPDRKDSADVAPLGEATVDQTAAAVDVFYVHPTTYLGSAWNAPVDDPDLNAATDELSTLVQASAFNGCCAIHGPRYRQANGDAFIRPGPEGDRALDLAYADVSVAFHHYLAESNRGRPFILAGHSQGSVHAARLLDEEIVGSELEDQLVAAYLIGAPLSAERGASLPACETADATGCVVSWNARGPRFAASRFDFVREGEWLCVNPLHWRMDESPAAAALNLGAVFLHAGDGTAHPGFASAQCVDGVLRVAEIGDPPRDFMSRILDFLLGPENYHPIEYQLFYMNLRRNAETRVSAFLRDS
jgi:hypothetical protein